jgi:murein DD-endopeptidase MepM/ murein hydrolase activator NlpD/alpha-beta hydrolase superfamily lysophospholipase
MSLANRPLRRLVRRRRHHERRRLPLRRLAVLLVAQLAAFVLTCGATIAQTSEAAAAPAAPGSQPVSPATPSDRPGQGQVPDRHPHTPRATACLVHTAARTTRTAATGTRTGKDAADVLRTAKAPADAAHEVAGRSVADAVARAPANVGRRANGQAGARRADQRDARADRRIHAGLALDPAVPGWPSRPSPRPTAGPAGGVSYVPPVAAEVVDPFRPPLVPWGSGNRGLEYDTEPGDLVWASADGVVTFAGQVGGMLHVTIQHVDGLRTGYSFLADVSVARGQEVRQGDPVGRAGDTFHFGARVGSAYVDPAALFDTGATVVELLPYEVPPGGRPEPEARLVDRAFARDSGPRGEGRSGLAAAYDWLRNRAEQTTSFLGEHSAPGRAIDFAFDLGDRVLFPAPCSHGPPPVAPAAHSRRVAITVAGLGSSSDRAAIAGLRTADLGYADDRVLRFSYAGGVVPATHEAADRFGVDAHAYGSTDTQGDLREAADRLADVVEQVLARDPGATVDLFAHSQGGLVTRLAVNTLEGRGVGLDRLGLVATLASPHQGADLATALGRLDGKASGSLALDIGRAATGTSIDPDAVSVAQLAEGSDIVAELAATGVPEGVQLVSIAARDDLVVASPTTEVEGATNVTVPVGGLGAHSEVVASDAATGELARALAREPPACEGPADAAADVLAGHSISAAEDTAGVLAFALAP